MNPILGPKPIKHYLYIKTSLVKEIKAHCKFSEENPITKEHKINNLAAV